MNDQERVIALLELRDSWVPGVKITRLADEPGEKATKRRECPACNGIGKRGRDKCERCSGSGRIVVDDYTGRTADAPPDTAADAVEARRERAKKRDDVLLRLERMERIRTGFQQEEGSEDVHTVANKARARLYRLGDFSALDLCLKRLEAEQPRLLGAVLLVHDPEASSVQRLARESMEREADRGIELLALWMPKPIRIPLDWTPPVQMLTRGRWANPEARKKRDKEVFRLWSQGHGPRAIGRQVGLSHVHVQRILSEVKAA